MQYKVIQGTPEADELTGTPGVDDIATYAGDDVVWARGGDDVVDGGAGWDQLFGEGGDDELLGSTYMDQLAGGDGNDTLRGGTGDDDLYGGAGDDEVWGGAGDDTLWMESQADDLDRLYGGNGNDLFTPYGGGASLTATAFGGAGDDLFSIDATLRDAVLKGGTGRDELAVLATDFGSATTPALRLLATPSGGTVEADGEVVATFTGVEKFTVQGLSGDDEVKTLGGRDEIRVSDGANIVFASGGPDTVAYMLGEANDLDGGAGTDRLELEAAYGLRVVFDALRGTDAFGSSLTAFEEFAVRGGVAQDSVKGGDGEDAIDLGGGADAGFGRGGEDHLDGGGGEDRLDGGGGNDVLQGWSGEDDLSGGTGADRLYGDTGEDRLTGGGGRDSFVFVFRDRATVDRIVDFEAGLDRVEVLVDRIDGALPEGLLDPARFHDGVAVGTEGQFVLLDLGAKDRLVWDANGTEDGGVAIIVDLLGESGLTADDILLFA